MDVTWQTLENFSTKVIVLVCMQSKWYYRLLWCFMSKKKMFAPNLLSSATFVVVCWHHERWNRSLYIVWCVISYLGLYTHVMLCVTCSVSVLRWQDRQTSPTSIFSIQYFGMSIEMSIYMLSSPWGHVPTLTMPTYSIKCNTFHTRDIVGVTRKHKYDWNLAVVFI